MFRVLVLFFICCCCCAGCDRPSEPSREELESVYARLVELNEPGEEPDEEKLARLRAEIDSLGGPARVESLMVRSMLEEEERWRLFLDSLAGREW